MDPIQKSLINVRGQLQKAEEKVQELEENVKDAEDAARLVKTHFFNLFYFDFTHWHFTTLNHRKKGPV